MYTSIAFNVRRPWFIFNYNSVCLTTFTIRPPPAMSEIVDCEMHHGVP